MSGQIVAPASPKYRRQLGVSNAEITDPRQQEDTHTADQVRVRALLAAHDALDLCPQLGLVEVTA